MKHPRYYQPEPASNRFFTCPDHADKPKPELAQRDPASFVGQYVKRAFLALNGTNQEHMWVLVDRVTPDGTLEGRLSNDPYYDVGVHYDDTVLVPLEAIEDVSGDA